MDIRIKNDICRRVKVYENDEYPAKVLDEIHPFFHLTKTAKK